MRCGEKSSQLKMARYLSQMRFPLRRAKIFPNVDLAPSMPKLNFVHESIDKVYPSTVVGVNSFGRNGAQYFRGIKPLPLVSHYNEDSPLRIASTADADFLARVLPVSVDDGIGYRFAKRHFYRKLFFRRAAILLE